MRAVVLDILIRLANLLIVLLGIATIIFSLPYLAPGGPERALIGWFLDVHVREFGYTDEQIEELYQKGVVKAGKGCH